ncbi:AEC family transporter [Streptomyces albidus (ex Kaewkla and Franco 2022)]|uniref:AEC family transporter n=1 Tax=Streptomyces albidus (ex Kaewkla and Franco 2022) TaxID=722709 RepID=UPI0015EF653C|nr:AEC family transporter [Streptomyces albidus (ex Kaewkla and Franco 2022)]
MGGVITGFAVITCIIGTGYVLGRRGLLGDNGPVVLTKLAFHVATPALLFETLAEADLSVLLSGPLLITALSTFAMAALYVGVAVVRRWPPGESTVGALCASYVNAGNLGIPIAAYVLGDASLVAPVILFQQLVISPVALTALDVFSTRTGDNGTLRRMTTPFRNPVVIGSLAGVTVAATGLTLPAPVLEPFELVGAMSVPAVLLAFGMSLRGSAVLSPEHERLPVLLAVTCKSVGQPLVAWVIGAGVFELSKAALFAVVVTSALPSAQNLFTYAARYEVGTRVARESILLSTLAAAPVLVAVAAVLG